jgi:integrase
VLAEEANVPVGTVHRWIRELLGHSTYAVTADTYAHVAVEQQREAAERPGEAFQW